MDNKTNGNITLTIQDAHGQVCEERNAELRSLQNSFQLLLREDKRHLGAVIKTFGHDPDEYASYDLQKNKDGKYILILTPKPKEEAGPQSEGEANNANALVAAAN